MMQSPQVKLLREQVVPAVFRAVDAGAALDEHWSELPDDPRAVALLAFGKAAGSMSRVATARLGGRLGRALVVGLEEEVSVLTDDGRMRVLASDHPIPTLRSVAAGREVTRFVAETNADERLAVLISGGGSAMLCAPRDPLALEDIVGVTDALLRSGATIGQVNCVRKHLELVKGGQLAQVCAGPAMAFVLSDVLGDRLDVIASGPFAPDPTTFAEALEVVRGFGLERDHRAAASLLERGLEGGVPETPKSGDAIFETVKHIVIAHNATAVEAACAWLRSAGWTVVNERTGVEGEASAVGRKLGALVRDLEPGQAIVWGGETTVTVGDAPGKGGRNLELALAAALEIESVSGAGVLSLATDGADGPTDAAGGVVDEHSVAAMRSAGAMPEAALAGHDSWHALAACGALIVTGPSGTNVNDVFVGIAG